MSAAQPRRGYHPPTVKALGSVVALTRSIGGSGIDNTGNASQMRVM